MTERQLNYTDALELIRNGAVVRVANTMMGWAELWKYENGTYMYHPVGGAGWCQYLGGGHRFTHGDFGSDWIRITLHAYEHTHDSPFTSYALQYINAYGDTTSYTVRAESLRAAIRIWEKAAQSRDELVSVRKLHHKHAGTAPPLPCTDE